MWPLGYLPPASWLSDSRVHTYIAGVLPYMAGSHVWHRYWPLASVAGSHVWHRYWPLASVAGGTPGTVPRSVVPKTQRAFVTLRTHSTSASVPPKSRLFVPSLKPCSRHQDAGRFRCEEVTSGRSHPLPVQLFPPSSSALPRSGVGWSCLTVLLSRPVNGTLTGAPPPALPLYIASNGSTSTAASAG